MHKTLNHPWLIRIQHRQLDWSSWSRSIFRSRSSVKLSFDTTVRRSRKGYGTIVRMPLPFLESTCLQRMPKTPCTQYIVLLSADITSARNRRRLFLDPLGGCNAGNIRSGSSGLCGKVVHSCWTVSSARRAPTACPLHLDSLRRTRSALAVSKRLVSPGLYTLTVVGATRTTFSRLLSFSCRTAKLLPPPSLPCVGC